MFLESIAKKRAVSEIEIDFNAVHILNRFLNQEKDSKKAANPGIESIWEDERVRRKRMDGANVPSLDPPVSQTRLNVQPTESDVFYKMLLRKEVEKTLDETINLSVNISTILTPSNDDVKPSTSISKKKYSLAPLIQDAVYAAECSDNTSQNSSQDFLNASQVQDHQEYKFTNLTQPLAPSDDDLNYSQTVNQLEKSILNYTQSGILNESRKHLVFVFAVKCSF